jgi:hypothetical protein
MTRILKLAQLIEADHVTEVNVRRGRIGAVLDAQAAFFLFGGFEFAFQFSSRKKVHVAGSKQVNLCVCIHNSREHKKTRRRLQPAGS